jgi:hypothetical protein
LKNRTILNAFGLAKGIFNTYSIITSIICIGFLSSNAQTTNRQLLRLSISNSTSIDYTVIYFEENRTLEFDSQFDAYKLSNPRLNIYTITPNGSKMSINGMPTNLEQTLIPLTVLAKTIGKQIIAVKTNDNNELFVKYRIIDSLTHTHIDATVGNSISFDIDNTQAGITISNRFYIEIIPIRNWPQPIANIVTAVETVNETANTDIYPNPTNGESLKINLKEEANISITDCNGKEHINKTMAASMNSSGTIDGFENLEKGVYIVTVSNPHGSKSYFKVLKN